MCFEYLGEHGESKLYNVFLEGQMKRRAFEDFLCREAKSFCPPRPGAAKEEDKKSEVKKETSAEEKPKPATQDAKAKTKSKDAKAKTKDAKAKSQDAKVKSQDAKDKSQDAKAKSQDANAKAKSKPEKQGKTKSQTVKGGKSGKEQKVKEDL